MAVKLLSVKWLPTDALLSYSGDDLMITMPDGTTMAFTEAWYRLTQGQRWVNHIGWRGAHGRNEIVRSPYL